MDNPWILTTSRKIFKRDYVLVLWTDVMAYRYTKFGSRVGKLRNDIIHGQQEEYIMSYMRYASIIYMDSKNYLCPVMSIIKRSKILEIIPKTC